MLLKFMTACGAVIYVRRIRARTVMACQTKRVQLRRSAYATQGTAALPAGRVTTGVSKGSLALVTFMTAAKHVRRIRARTVMACRAKRVLVQPSVLATQGTAARPAGRAREAGIKDAAGWHMSGAHGSRVKRKAKVLEKKPLTRPAWGDCDIAVVTHESMELTFYSCVCDDVLEHAYNLPDRGLTPAKVQMYLCVPGAAWCDQQDAYQDGLQVVGREKFKKILVQATTELRDIDCGLMLILAHGNVENEVKGCTPYIAFFDDANDLETQRARVDGNLVVVHAAPVPPEEATGTPDVTMLEVTRKARLCVLMCCFAGHIVAEHLMSDATRDYFARIAHSQGADATTREYLYFCTDDGNVRGYAIEILISWIINLVDYSQVSDNRVPENVDVLWRQAMVRIMQTVKIFRDDYKGFFRFLCVVGLIEQGDALCKRMQMARLHKRSEFVVGGHKYLWQKAAVVPRILSHFQALSLTTYTHLQAPTHLTPETSDDLLLSPDANVDTFLKRYIQRRSRSSMQKQTDEEMFGEESSSSEQLSDGASSSDGAGSATELRSDESDGEQAHGDLRACLKALQAMDA